MLHVDAEHLYEHTHLPPHYLVMFLPSLQTAEEVAEEVGQTAFILGSHVAKSAQRVAAQGREEAHRQRYMFDSRHGNMTVRPHCKSGDVLLFDARIMHFGMANKS